MVHHGSVQSKDIENVKKNLVLLMSPRVEVKLCEKTVSYTSLGRISQCYWFAAASMEPRTELMDDTDLSRWFLIPVKGGTPGD